MRRVDAAPRDGPDRQQLVWQVPSRDALVARGALCFVESPAFTGKESRLVRVDSSSRARAGEVARLPRRPLAKDGGTGRTRQSFAGWTAANLAAAASDLLRRALLSFASQS